MNFKMNGVEGKEILVIERMKSEIQENEVRFPKKD